RLPKERILFIVDTIPVGSFPGRGMIDFFPLETEAFITKVLALDWDRVIPGHPGQPNDRLGTKDDAKNVLALYQDASAEMKKMGQAGKRWDEPERASNLPKYESLPGYANGLPFVARRFCALWGGGPRGRSGKSRRAAAPAQTPSPANLGGVHPMRPRAHAARV